MRRLTVLAALFVATGSLLAQNVPQSISATDVPTGVVVEEAGRDKSSDEPYDVPELYGSRPHELRSGERLPQVLAEYVVRSGKLLQRISIFDNGVGVVHLRGGEGNATRRLLLADEPIDTVRKVMEQIDIHGLRTSDPFRDPSEYAELRIARGGKLVSIALGANEVQPQSIETLRVVMSDLLAAMMQDRQISNPIAQYHASVGDRLVSEDGRTYRVTRLIEDGSVVELEMTSKPLRIVVPSNLLYKMFVDVRLAEKRAAE